MSMDRRQFLSRTAALSAGFAAAGLFAESGVAGAFPLGGYGPLITDPNGIIDLPAGFSYKVLSSPSTTLGVRADLPANEGAIPQDPDGMASFYDASTKRTYLVVNHEISTSEAAKAVPRTYKGNPVPTYDSNTTAYGGCSVIILDEFMDVIEHRPAIAGTLNNCAGGPTPWGTWLTCEENSTNLGTSPNLVPHGYLLEVDPKGVLTTGVPYKAMGRANHEAAAVNPNNSDVFITEDGGVNALLYKFVPTDKSQQFGSLGNGGTLYAMKVPGYLNFAELTTNGMSVAGVTWVEIPNPTNVPLPQDATGLQSKWAAADVTRGNKLEGAWWADGKLWFVSSYSSYAGFAHEGQVFTYDPATETITLVVRIPVGGLATTLTDGVTTQPHTLSSPDNIAVTPYGGAIWSEDGADPNYLVCVDPAGACFALAKNPGAGECAGAHFSADGKWLFAAMQVRNLVVAITGPWAATPPVDVPEVPTSVLLPMTGAVTLAALLALRGRRMSEV